MSGAVVTASMTLELTSDIALRAVNNLLMKPVRSQRVRKPSKRQRRADGLLTLNPQTHLPRVIYNYEPAPSTFQRSTSTQPNFRATKEQS